MLHTLGTGNIERIKLQRRAQLWQWPLDQVTLGLSVSACCTRSAAPGRRLDHCFKQAWHSVRGSVTQICGVFSACACKEWTHILTKQNHGVPAAGLPSAVPPAPRG